MAESTNTIDINALKAEVEGLSEADLRELVLSTKVRQMVATKKYYNPETAKRARQKAAEKYNLAVAALKASGQYDEIMAQAKEMAEEKLANEAQPEEVEV